jgi:hypothetical protein
MSRGPATFKQTDLSRALKAATTAGVKVARIEIDRAGKIVLVTGEAKPGEVANANEWDAAQW